MTTLVIRPNTTSTYLRVAGATILGAAVTFSLFALMHALTKQSGTHQPELTEYVPIMPVFEKKDSNVIEQQKLPPLPEPKPKPKTENIIEPVEPNDQIALSNEVITQPTTQYDGVKIDNLGSGDGDVRPIVRTSPRYPMDAARNGIEGWVKLSFAIDIDGSVMDINIIDSQPSSIFNREARRALAKWKYKPQKIDGNSTVRHGLQVILTFELNENS